MTLRTRPTLLAAALLLATPVLAGPLRLALDAGWRFMPGNDPGFAAPGLDDRGWAPIVPGSPWEKQGHLKVAGVAWYRLHFTLPTRLRAEDRWQGGVRLELGTIGDCDQTFLNGRIIGHNGISAGPTEAPDPAFEKDAATYLDKARVYRLRPDDPRLNWGGDNVLAVEVLDTSGAGGLTSPHPLLRLETGADLARLDLLNRDYAFVPEGLVKTFEVANTGSVRTLAGTLDWSAVGLASGAAAASGHLPVSVPPEGRRPFTIQLPKVEESLAVTCTLRFEGDEEPLVVTEASPYVLTPPAPAAPRINGPAVVGLRPGRPFLYQVPASGDGPKVYAARNLPEGLALDPGTGILTGRVAAKGSWPVELTVASKLGTATRTVTLVAGDRLALTPPMGWNSWNCWGLTVSEERVMASAHAFVDQGLRDHGWAFVNIDDGWEIKGDAPEPKRDAQGRIRVNAKFPDMARLGRRLHELGLHFGIYSSPGPLTCGLYTASWQHELDDAKSYAEWGVDYLKYDWCSYGDIVQGRTREELMKPYQVMRGALDQVDRDIVFSLCQYGMGKVWEWGGAAGGNLWRTSGDIEDTWESLSTIGFRQVADAPYAKPGNWNDPDMLVVGWVGWGDDLHRTRLTPDEQYTHISLWSLLSAPLLIGCDLPRLEPFTLGLLTNDEVLALDQDAKGAQAVPKVKAGDLQVWVKDLADGGKAFGVFNLGAAPATWKLDLAALGIAPAAPLRDLWRQRDLAPGTGSVRIPPHGVVLLKAGLGARDAH